MNVAEIVYEISPESAFAAVRGAAKERSAALRAAIEPADSDLHAKLAQDFISTNEDSLHAVAENAGDKATRDAYISHLEKYNGACESAVDTMHKSAANCKAKVRDSKIMYGVGGALAAGAPLLLILARR